jgi:diguanylate cyclase (GGDEF)-like protein
MENRRLFQMLRSLPQPAPLFGFAVIAICWISLGYFLSVERDRTIAAALQDGTRLTQLLEENATRLIKVVDRTLLLLRSAYEKHPEQFDLQALVKDSSAVSDVTTEIALISSNGYLTAKTGYHGPPIYVGDVEHFQFRADAKSDQIYISKPFVLRTTGARTILISRRLHKPDGSFGGIIAASIAPELIEGFYQSLSLPPQNNIILRGLDGAIRSSFGLVRQYADTDRIPRDLTDALVQSPTGYFWLTGPVDAVKRLIFYRTFTGYSLVVTHGVTEDNILSGYRYHQRIYIAVVGVLTILIVIAIMFSIRRQTSLEQSNFRFGAALENMTHGLSMFDVNKRLVVCNQHYADMYRIPPELTVRGTPQVEIIRHRVLSGILKGENSQSALTRKLADLSPESFKNSNRIEELADGRLIRITRKPMKGGGWVATHEDVTEQQRSESKIAFMAHNDGLTNLSNRVAFLSKLEEAATRQRQDHEPFSVLLLDLDRFKIINDCFGHPVGDAALKKLADRLCSCIRENDTVARLGGDEFAIIQIGEANQREAAEALARRITEVVSTPFDFEGRELTIGTSIGIAVAPEHGSDPDTLLKMADLALYRAKAEGRNRFCFFTQEMGEATIARHSLETDLRQAIARNELELHYLPIIDTSTGRVSGAEALVRWRHPRMGLMFPATFIPLAEETGLITQIGDWVLQTACVDAATWPATTKVTVNLSPVQVRNSDLLATVTRALSGSGLQAERLELEITEAALIDNEVHCATLLRQFKGLGVTIALDDFGTGYSSLSQLTNFPIDRIKIDRSFTKNFTRSADCAAIISATMRLAYSLSIATTAEGVETRQQYRLLKWAGVSSVQGYLFSLPCRVSEIDFGASYGDQAMDTAA